MALKPTRREDDIARWRNALSGRRAAVIGAARSGIAAMRVLAQAQATVVLADMKSAEELPDAVAAAREAGAEFLPRFEQLEQLPEIDLMVVSPGIPADHPAVLAARGAEVEVIGEVELAWRLCPAPIVAITGTNGKGTCCRLLADMLTRGDVPNVLAGNIGNPLCGELPCLTPAHVVVLEVSSFQLESIADFRPSVGVLLNLVPEHGDRHRSLAEYLRAKARLFENQTEEDWAIGNLDDPVAASLALHSAARHLTVSVRDTTANGYVREGTLLLRLDGQPQEICRADEFPLRGAHHLPGVLSAALAACLADVPLAASAAAIRSYQPPPHHMERVAEVGGVVFYNDSKASNPAAAIADLSALQQPWVAIVGGVSKGARFEELGALLARRAKGVVLIGEAAPAIAAAMGPAANPQRADTLEQATELAWSMAEPGDVVILAPACSSFDMFRNYAHRGDVFRQKARQLEQQHARG